MTSLPISLPPDYSPVVKKGDKVTNGQILATTKKKPEVLRQESLQASETMIDLAEALSVSDGAVRKFLTKAPGDTVSSGDIVAQRLVATGLKKLIVYSQVIGTVSRFERDSGRLYIRSESSEAVVPIAAKNADILSPLAGTISVCNNDQIVIESEDKALTGSEGFGGSVTGEIFVLTPEGDKAAIVSSQIVKEAIGKILLLPDIEREALAKADAIGVVGILGTELSEELLEHCRSSKLDISILAIDPAIGKKLVKFKNPVILHGEEKSIILQE